MYQMSEEGETMNINIRRIAFPVTSLGIGKRICIWTSGCDKSCDNCISHDLKTSYPGDAMEIGKVFSIIDRAKDAGVTGLTVSGGEPFLQVEELLFVCEYARSLGLDILVYTGYEPAELRKITDIERVRRAVDVLVTGRYADPLNDKNDRLARLRGSSNQQVFFINRNLVEDYMKYCSKGRQVIVIGTNTIVGIP